ncbi:MAG: winged helix-turn-helix transcriptional regulator [Candidatus Omnitrophica bacterium]|nr:winged helix-turn-helix transcriptional regulator [Candidatus Omnitrophota bacterium]
MKPDYEKGGEFLKALAHPVRLKMVMGLLKGHDCDVNTMVANLKLPQSTISQHLGVLKSKGIVSFRKDGVRACYRVVDGRVEAILKVLGK